MAKKITAIVLAFSLLFTAFAIPASADDTSSAERGFYRFVDGLLDAVVSGIAALIFEPHDWADMDEYVSENFYEGNSAEEFLDAPAADAAWSLGYSSGSLLTGKELEEEHYVGGSLSITKKLATDVKDDQRVRTIAISDGRGISIFAVLDSFGLANNEVRVIREKFQAYADAKNLDITSINISCLHQHSCVDTFGLNGDIVNALFTSSINNLLGIEAPSGKNKNYMENLYKVTVQSMVDAVEGMEEGNLYYGNIDISEYIRDKREPKVYDGNLNRIRFVPANENSRETWLVNLPIHCVGHGAGGTVLTGDYPYYMEQYIDEKADANFIQILGAELAITSEYPVDIYRDPDIIAEHGDGYAGLITFGQLLGERACSITNDEEILPILNIRFTEKFLPIENGIFKVAGKGGLLTNEVVRDGLDYYTVTEVGYAEFGTDLAIALIPGELAPEIAYGGAITPEESWDGTTWNYSTFADLTDRKLIVFGVTNDQVGYMMTENDWRSYLTENEEIVSTGPKAGAVIAAAYLELFDEVN